MLVWARALIIILPLSAQLGAMLCTLRKAAEEACVLVPVLVVVVLGFGTTLCAVYQDVVPEYSNLAGSLRMLVAITGGNMDLMVSLLCCLRLYRWIFISAQHVQSVYIRVHLPFKTFLATDTTAGNVIMIISANRALSSAHCNCMPACVVS